MTGGFIVVDGPSPDCDEQGLDENKQIDRSLCVCVCVCVCVCERERECVCGSDICTILTIQLTLSNAI